jgi:hypothetical protein
MVEVDHWNIEQKFVKVAKFVVLLHYKRSPMFPPTKLEHKANPQLNRYIASATIVIEVAANATGINTFLPSPEDHPGLIHASSVQLSKPKPIG